MPASKSSPTKSNAVAAVASAPGGELLGRSTFKDDQTLPWMPLFLEPATGDTRVENGSLCARIEHPGKNAWDVQLRHREMTIKKGHTYSVRYTAWASAPIRVRAQIGMSGPPYTSYWSDVPDISTSRKEFSGSFTSSATDDPSAEFAFHMGDPGAKAPVTVCIDDLHLTDPEFTPAPKTPAVSVPPIRVNQLGYYPKGPKRATWVVQGSDAPALAGKATPFEIVDSTGAVVHRGTTLPFGKDPTSGLFVQRIDFSSYRENGEGLRIRVKAADGTASAESDPFAIRPSVLKALSRDALRYFYYTRSGIALVQPYVENDRWLRPVGHPTDKQVPCAPDAKCSYSLDVSGGWYDAGDYGKYVVNGGLSVWLLMNLWEASQQLSLPVAGAKDGDLHLPESGNKLPDLLDEARWEMDWLLKMQVPEGDANAGLVHHKMHDTDWSALGTPPVLGDNPRQLRPVSTAATLNLAATAAQAARVFAKLDPKFAERCLSAAKRAWAAAEAHPDLIITNADNRGGGAYDDATLSDERFWAASELFVTTGDKAYFGILSKSPHYLQLKAHESATPEAMDWRTTDALGTLSLALESRSTPVSVREANRKSIVNVAEKYLAMSKADGFGQPYVGAHYVWGSNSFIVNNGVIMAYAHAFTKDPRFLAGAAAAMDYVLGRNALGKSYVSGYGARPLTNPHHRLWAHSIDPKFPSPPPGVLSGGPNSDLQDPYSKGLHPHCIGQTCYVDHIEAYSANEEAINWNAALSWLAAYVDATQ